MKNGLLVVLAHPDDESFGCAGLMALTIAAGKPVTYLCATRGQMGRRLGKPPVATRESLAALRERELAAAMAAIGVDDWRFLSYWDKTVEFVPQAQLVADVTAALERVEPALVVTFHPEYGGHPDHDAVGRATVAAVNALPPDRRPAIWCPTGPLDEEDGPSLPLEIVDIRSVSDVKRRAFDAHRSQTSGWEEELAQNERWRERFANLFIEERFWVYVGGRPSFL